MKRWIALAIAMAAGSLDAREVKPGKDPVDDGYMVCSLFEKSSEEVTDCDVEINWGEPNSVEVTIPMSASEALKACKGSVKMVHAAGFTALRREGWELRFLSPYSGDKAIAKCKF